MNLKYIFNPKSKTHWLNLLGAIVTALTSMKGVISPELFPVIMGSFVAAQHYVRGLTSTKITEK